MGIDIVLYIRSYHNICIRIHKLSINGPLHHRFHRGKYKDDIDLLYRIIREDKF